MLKRRGKSLASDGNWTPAVQPVARSHTNWAIAALTFFFLNCAHPIGEIVLPPLALSLILLPRWIIGHPWNALFHFSFLILGQSVGHLGRGISPSQGRLPTQTQNKRVDIHSFSGIRTHDPSARAGEDSSCLRPRGHCDRRAYSYTRLILESVLHKDPPVSPDIHSSIISLHYSIINNMIVSEKTQWLI
jgi:hypothetical protein